MPSWYSSWLPGLPSVNFALPSSLQGRFISFVLKKSLGRFLRPGQLDSKQIDSQIGAGFVRVNDLELDNGAINAIISDFPVVLHDGFISSVVARIPWPNPLTSTLGFSVDSLHLTFHLLPPSSNVTLTSTNLADTVASVAESFLHDELSPQEGATLRDSFLAGVSSAKRSEDAFAVPGALAADPLLSNPEEVLLSDADPAGVSMFASLIERLLAKFEFDASNTQVTLVHPGNMSITASILDIRYCTDNNAPPVASERFFPAGQRRLLSIAGLSLIARDLRSKTPSSELTKPNAHSPLSFPPSSSHHNPRPISPSSSSSSLDEDTHFAMSQSLAFLPPRPSSPTGSVASSMYESAISTVPVSIDNGLKYEIQPGSRPLSIPQTEEAPHVPRRSEESLQDDKADTLLFFGSSPILIHISTPSPSADGDVLPSSSPTEPSIRDHVKIDESIHLNVSVGVVACVVHAWHIRGLLNLCDDFVTYNSYNDPTLSSNPGPLQSGIDMKASVKLRGLVLLVPLTSPYDLEAARGASFAEFFKSPLVPPILPDGYLRLYLEAMSASISPLPELDAKSGVGPIESARPIMAKSLSYSLIIGDISLFSMYGISNATPTPGITSVASPILITDHGLPSQYAARHYHPSKGDLNPDLPTFEILDWTAEKYRSKGLKLSFWRNKSSQGCTPARKESTTESQPLQPAISIILKKASVPSSWHQPQLPSNEVELTVIPLHVFLDLGNAIPIDRLVTFLDEAVGGGSESGHGSSPLSRPGDEYSDCSDAEVATPPISPRARSAQETDKERRRLKKLVFEDLDSDIDYGVKPHVDDTAERKQRTRKRKPIQQSTAKTSITFDMIRIQVRCPPPPQRPARSGALAIDLHGIELFVAPQPSKKSIRFATAELSNHSEAPQTSDETFVFGADFKRIVVASCPAHESTAKSIFSLGSLVSKSDLEGHNHEVMTAPIKPRLIITQSNHTAVERSTVLVLSAEIPSVVVDISKPILDSLQYWADDVAQHLDRALSGGDIPTDKTDSRDTSLIGSRFFAKSRSGSGSAFSTSPGSSQSETVVKLAISEAFVRAMVPRAQQCAICPFITYASDLDVLVEMKDETVLTLHIMDVTIKDAGAPHSDQTFVSLTNPRSLMSAPRSMVKLVFTSLVVPGTTSKESRVKLTLSGFTFTLFPDFAWVADLAAFFKSPPGTFDSVIPSERTCVSIEVSDGAIRAFAPNHSGAIVIQVDELNFATDVVGESPDDSFRLSVPALALLAIDDVSNVFNGDPVLHRGVPFWKSMGFALLAEVADLSMTVFRTTRPRTTTISIDRVRFQMHICADSLFAVTAFADDFGTVFTPPGEERMPKANKRPAMFSEQSAATSGLMASVDDLAFKKVPEVGPSPDMISDDLPTNMDYLDESFGAAGGLRELRDNDLDEFDVDESQPEYSYTPTAGETGVVSRVGGETIKILHPEGVQITENHFDNLPPDAGGAADEFGVTTFRFRLRIHHGDITLFLYDGYDWIRTRKTIEEEVKDMRRRLAKIRQLVAAGQTQDPSAEETSALLFNSLYIGLDRDVDGLEPGAIIAAIDEELKEDLETASQSSWQSLKPPAPGQPRGRTIRVHGKQLTRSRGPSMEFRLFGLDAEVDHYLPDAPDVARTFATIRDVEILDHIKTSSWKKFLTELRSDSRGNIRETDSNMVRVELRTVRPVPKHPAEEARLRAKILPLRLYVDQDAVDFLKSFFSFKEPHASPTVEAEDDQIYFQSAEVFPVDLKLDYKPRRVDYRALREGRTIELMNFFHFDGAEMTLRHITLAGITGWPRLFELLNDLWTPDVKATQLVEVISGVAPIRSIVNVGSGVADLVLLPIAQYKKDGRIVRGVQKGTTAFVKSTAIEAIKLGARLATGTQVILEQAEGVLGGQFDHPITAETVQSSTGDDFTHLVAQEDGESADTISKYAQQPSDIKEGMQSAYKSLRRNLNSAAQTILAVPMEVYERSGNEGPVRSVIRAVPIAVLKPMIGASEAVSKTLLGLHNTLDPDVRHDNEAKYKRR